MLHHIAAPIIFVFLAVVFCPRIAVGLGTALLLVPRLLAGLAVVAGIAILAGVAGHH